MNCKFVRDRLSAYIDRELLPADFYLIRAHLSACDECQLEERELRSLKNLLSGGTIPEPSVDFEARLLRSIHDSTAAVRPSYPKALGPMLLFAGVAAASMVVALQFASPGKTVSRQVYLARDFASDVRQDQVYEAAASDPLFGAPVVTALEYGR